jgi:2-polyprenyl-6-methoxyphenol hydroxylase-like FAD-dependent oxidoreductase
MHNNDASEVIVIGGGIGGLTLALALHRAGIKCRVYESSAEIRPLGVGLNLLPHALHALGELGLEAALLAKGIETREYCFYTRHGQLVYREPRGRFAGYSAPQISIHRADLHGALLDAVTERLGADAIRLNHRCVDLEQTEATVTVHFVNAKGEAQAPAHGAIAIACDGVHSVARAKYHPDEAKPRYEGTTQYRGVTRWKPFLTGASMIYMGTFETGKLIMYPVRNNVDADGNQLFNWVIEVSRPDDRLLRDWNRRSEVSEFISHFEDASFDWLDITAVLRAADAVYEYPMVDQDPLSFWTSGRVTLLGDAAHPMMPRGSNGAAQAILDASTLAGLLAGGGDQRDALGAYEAKRLKATSDVVLANRGIAPDAILRVIEERTAGKPFRHIDDVISQEELQQWQDRYRQVAGFAGKDLGQPSGRR